MKTTTISKLAKVTLALAVTAAAPRTAQAFLIAGSSASSDKSISVAPPTASGQTLAVWQVNGKVRGEIRRADGSVALAAADLLIPGAGESFSDPAVTQTANGHLVVAKKTAAGLTSIVAREVVAGALGATHVVGAPLPSVDYPGGPRVASYPNAVSKSLVVFRKGSRIFGQIVTNGGVRSGQPLVVASGMVGVAADVDVALDSFAGGCWVVYISVDEFHAGIFATLVRSDGRMGPPIYVASVGPDVGGPAIAWNSFAAAAMIVWRDGSKVAGKTLGSTGGVGSGIAVSSAASFVARPAITAVTGTPDFFVAHVAFGATAISTDVALARVSSAGVVRRLAKLASSPESEYGPALTLINGNLVAVWTSEDSWRDPITGKIKRDTDVHMSVNPAANLR